MNDGPIANPEEAKVLEPPMAHLPTKLAIDFGPLLVFFIANAFGNPFLATGAVMVASLIALGAGYMIERKLEPMPLATAVLVLILGGLTLALGDKGFIQMKPTF